METADGGEITWRIKELPLTGNPYDGDPLVAIIVDRVALG